MLENRYIRNLELKQLITNKRISLVGPSSHLAGKGLGEYIDNYDLVCRVNDVTAKYHEDDYGYKTDLIVYSCPTLGQDDFLNRMLSSPDIAMGVKGLICPTTKADHQYRDSPEENFKKINIFNIPFFYEGKENYPSLCQEIGVEPSMGIAAIVTLLMYQPKELFITGFSFYHQFNENLSVEEKYNSIYYPGCVMPQYQKSTLHPFRGHNQVAIKEYFKNVILKNYSDIVKIDSCLKDILGVEYENVKDIGGL